MLRESCASQTSGTWRPTSTRCASRPLMQLLRLEVRVPLERFPFLVTRHQRPLRDLIAMLEQPRHALVPHVAQLQVRDAERPARLAEVLADGLRMHREDRA